jgi:hypothetical protein
MYSIIAKNLKKLIYTIFRRKKSDHRPEEIDVLRKLLW